MWRNYKNERKVYSTYVWKEEGNYLENKSVNRKNYREIFIWYFSEWQWLGHWTEENIQIYVI